MLPLESRVRGIALGAQRRQLRREFGFPANPKRRFGVPCVWSDEPQAAPAGTCGPRPEGSLNCAGFGACMPVTASFGLAAAGYVIDRIVVRGGGSTG